MDLISKMQKYGNELSQEDNVTENTQIESYIYVYINNDNSEKIPRYIANILSVINYIRISGKNDTDIYIMNDFNTQITINKDNIYNYFVKNKDTLIKKINKKNICQEIIDIINGKPKRINNNIISKNNKNNRLKYLILAVLILFAIGGLVAKYQFNLF